MPERDGYIPGVPCWVDTSQPDPEAAVEFYEGLFGWEFEDVMPPGSGGSYYLALLHGSAVAAVGSLPEAAPATAMWDTYIWVESADDTASKVRDAGGGVVKEPFDVMDAGRMYVLTDPEGAVFCVWQAKRHRGARIVNEPGSLNFNDLNTSDVAGVKSFYGSVFGWEMLGLEGGFEMDTARLRRPRARQSRPPRPGCRDRQPGRIRGRRGQHQPDRRRPARRAGALGRDVRGRRRRRDRRESPRARRHGRRPPVRCSVGPHDRPHRPAGRDVRREQVRAREQGRRSPGGRPRRSRLGVAVGGSVAVRQEQKALLRRAFSVDGNSRERRRSFGWCGQSMRSVEGEHRWEDDNDRGGQQGESGKVGGLPALEPVERAAPGEESGRWPGGTGQVHGGRG